MLAKLSPAARFKLLMGIIVFAILAIGYAALVQPRMGRAGEINAQAADQQIANAKAESGLAQLKEQAANLPAEKQKAAAIGVKFPASANEAELLNQINQAAAASGIAASAVTNISLTPPTAVSPGGGADGASVGVPEATASPDASGATPAASTNRIASMSVTFAVTADNGHLVAFLSQLENGPRAFLVSKVSQGGAASAGAAATVNIEGTMFVIPAPTLPTTPAKPAQPAAGATPAPAGN